MIAQMQARAKAAQASVATGPRVTESIGAGVSVGADVGAGVTAAATDARAMAARAMAGGVDPGRTDTWDQSGRNDPCPCGSGKKYKHCHGRV